MFRIPKNRPPTHPGEMLMEEFLKPLKMTQVELAEKLGVSYPRVNELIHKKRGVTPDTALRLEQLFGMEAYLLHHLVLAGLKTNPFEESAITAIQQGSGGLFRKANHLARGALIAAAAEKSLSVTPEHVRLAATGIF